MYANLAFVSFYLLDFELDVWHLSLQSRGVDEINIKQNDCLLLSVLCVVVKHVARDNTLKYIYGVCGVCVCVCLMCMFLLLIRDKLLA